VKRIVTVQLDAVLYVRLKRLTQHVIGTPMSRFVRMAIEDKIEKALRDNDGWRKTFERYQHEDDERAAQILLRERKPKPALKLVR